MGSFIMSLDYLFAMGFIWNFLKFIDSTNFVGLALKIEAAAKSKITGKIDLGSKLEEQAWNTRNWKAVQGCETWFSKEE